jgi:hypothetical protein
MQELPTSHQALTRMHTGATGLQKCQLTVLNLHAKLDK